VWYDASVECRFHHVTIGNCRGGRECPFEHMISGS
jgi:hypothetical protein